MLELLSDTFFDCMLHTCAVHCLDVAVRKYSHLPWFCQVFRCTLPRVGLNLDDYPQIKKIYNNCLKLPQVQKAMPAQQPDAPEKDFWTSLDA